jgi:intracellular sulfur oxidation DsrE/DsrF family protein
MNLSFADITPHVVVMMNAGVKLAAEGSEHLESLEDLAKKGTEILACGTCLDFFHLRQKLKVGKASNMAEITKVLSEASQVISI